MTEIMASGTVASPDFDYLCRLCASKTSVLMGLHIFEREGDSRQIFKKITACLPVQVALTDKLPKMVCEECVYKLDLLFEFREKSVKTETYLENVLKTIEQQLPLIPPPPAVEDASDCAVTESAPAEVEQIKSNDNVKCEPEVLIKVEDVSNIVVSMPEGEESDTDTETDSESESESDSDDNTGAEDSHNGSLSALAEPHGHLENESTVVVLGSGGTEASTSHFEKIENEDGAGIEAGVNFMNPAANGLLMLSCSQASEYPDQASWFFCHICGKAFAKREEFQLHYEDHCNKCKVCGALFTNEEALKVHCKEMHLRKHKLSDKPIILEEKKGVMRRKKWEPKVCPECGKQYRTNYKLTEHMRKHTGEKPFKCSTCTKAFRSKIGLAQHEAKHTGQYEYTCNTCGKGFQCKSYLIVHQRVHSDLKPYPCTTCGRNFKTKQSLLDHQNRHLGVKPYLCETCGRRFITKGLCKSHQRVHSGTDNKQFPCTVCNKMFVSKSYLATHLRIHTGEKPFMCEVCGKGFLTRVDLRIHSTMHTGEKSFVCEWCGKAFARRDALRCHRRSHTGERPYRCEICGQSFTQFSPLTIHKRLHTGERPYSCDICEKAFVSRSTMMSHRKKHHT
ncbi:zinc finger protein 2 homolog [Zootermopsis nevadensis]|uniref:Uncharacterized protein n=1 Tax=Zootermopsis nevadensis TaxID=136037 RepID=A0A067RJS5_ZOONE|nr:zinc finger protein 2 homolog [Zootermopsis nevadensis]KDR19660.1 hypothetical protein L798_06181 [Zootermopsis nevadensis]